MKYIFLFLLIFGCKNFNKTKTINADIKNTIRLEIDSIRPLLPTCEFQSITYACKQDNDDGDSTKWIGLLCLSGEQEQCDALPYEAERKR